MSYDEAFKHLMEVEGTYSNLSTDLGGETYKGIARNRNPQWEGWKVIDLYRKYPNFPKSLEANKELQDFIKEWYKMNYWDPFNLDGMSDSISHEIFDQAVNIGVGQTTKHIQRVCNALNADNRFGADLNVDGAPGPNTRKRLREADIFCARYPAPILARAVDSLQGAYYVELANGTNAAIQRKNFVGWINKRVGTPL